MVDAKARVLIQRLLEELEHATDSEYQAGLKDLARNYLAQPTSEDDFNHECSVSDAIADGQMAELLQDALKRWGQPEPQTPTDKELHQLWQELYSFQDGPTSGDVAEIARAVLKRWGQPAREEPRSRG